MKIKTIAGTNIKGQSFRHALKPVTLIVGDNYTGKSARIEAVKLALLGYVPGLGRRPQDIFALATGTKMIAGITDEAGTEIRREWRMENGTIKTSNMLGLTASTPPVLLDTREYFEKTAAERLQYVFSKVDASRLGYTTEASVTAELRALKPEAPNEHHEAAIDRVLAKAKALSEHRAAEEATLQEWLSLLLEELRAEQKENNAVLKSMVGMVSGTAQLKATEPLRPPPANVDAEIKHADKSLRAALADQATQKQQLEAHRQWKAEREQFEREAKEAGDHAGQIKKLEAEAAALAEKIKAHKDKVPVAGLEAKKWVALVSAANQERTGLQTQIKTLDAEHDAVLKHERCPTCDSKGVKWKAAFKAKYKAESERLNKAFGAAMSKAKEAMAELQSTEKALSAAQAANDRHNANVRQSQELATRLQVLRQKQERVTALRAKVSKEPPLPDAAAMQETEKRVNELTAQLAALQQQARAAAAANQDALRQAQARAKQEQLRATGEVLQLAIAKLSEIQARLVQVTFGKLLETARMFTDGILGFELIYRDGELGYVRGGQWVSHWTFSGSEQLLAYAGLSVALTQEATYKIVLMDELGRLASATKEKLLTRMLELTERGVIDNFVGVDTGDAFPARNKDMDALGIGVIEVI